MARRGRPGDEAPRASRDVLAHQYLDQLDEQVQRALLGNVGTLIVFRVGVRDAETLEKEFWPEFRVQDLVSLPRHQIYLRLMIDGVVSKPFSAETLPPLQPQVPCAEM